MREAAPSRFGFWKGVLGAALAMLAAVAVMRYTRGLGAVTNLSDRYPWGLWIGFDILCGVGLAAGGFAITATVHLFHLRRFEPIVRPTVLTAFLGYLLVIVGLLFDLGQPWRIWHALVMWNPHSVMFEVAWCVMLYTTVLALEFSPVVFERFGLQTPRRILRAVTVPLVIVGVLLSTLHQSSLGSLYLIVPHKLHPLWYTPMLPVFFFVSAVAAGLAMVIVESRLSARAFGRHLEVDLLADLARVMLVVLGLYGVLRLEDLAGRGAFAYFSLASLEGRMFALEVLVGVVAPIVLLALPRVRRHGGGLYLSALLVVFGFMMHRLNVSLTGLEASAGVRYFPSWMEIAVSFGIVAAGFGLFALAVKHLPVFTGPEAAVPGVHAPQAATPPAARARPAAPPSPPLFRPRAT
ncbi:MAG TPA: Ni/Fe-hydrogenase cytochrome b subunit [Candidatus Sulfotelmatobacter sp.]|nr:Ni/Fe-hydrogenase cytochrome b subunit [Candidatus Sulfotelmatobacter sp.]